MAASIEEFLYHEAQLLDDARFDEWLALYTDTAWYWVPIQPGQDNPFDTVSIIYDDRKLMETRVRRLGNQHIHAQSPASRTSRLIGNVTINQTGKSDQMYQCDIQASSRFQMVEYRQETQRVFAGAQHHGLVRRGETFNIAWKRVDLVNCDAMMEGITIPF